MKMLRRRAKAAAGAAVIALAGLSAACGGGKAPLSAVQPSQAPVPSGPAAMRGWAAAADGGRFQAMRGDLSAMRHAARGNDAGVLMNAGQALHDDATAYLDEMNAITPPPPAAAAHQRLLTAVYDLHSAGQAAAGGDFQSCAAYLDKADSRLREAQADLPGSAALSRFGHTLRSLASLNGADACMGTAAR